MPSGLLPCSPLMLGSGGYSPTYSDYTLEPAMVAYLLANAGVAAVIDDRLYNYQVARANTAWPVVTWFRNGTEPYNNLQGSAGASWATFSFDCWSTNQLDTYKAAEALRRALQGFRGSWGCVAIGAVILDDVNDSIEQPQDSSGSCWYSRSLDFNILYGEYTPTF